MPLDDLPETVEDLMKQKRVRFNELKEHIDSVNAKLAPLKAKLTVENDACEKHRVASMKIAEEINELRGGKKWFVIKKEFGRIAKELGGL
jgi:uncharacterized coiled-coil DUF342 family protein